ncbi:MAG: YihY family inner membrane protein [Deltaproteobacteria bacterium]|nr:YihY family inner membrane protein [Deltaproteobacteria bacterium]
MKKSNIFDKISLYLSHTIWDLDLQSMFFPKRVIFYILRLFYLVNEGLIKNKCAVWTTSLAFTTLLQIVPLLAVMFYVFQMIGGMESVPATKFFENFILSNLTVGAGEQVREYLRNFSGRIHSGVLGVAGVVFLILTVVTLMSTIEKAFNNIWGVQKHRSFFVRVSVYWSLITIGPLLAVLSLSLTASFQSEFLIQKVLEIKWLSSGFVFTLPYIFSSLALTLLYIFMPNTKVKIKSALTGGIIAGILWEFSKVGFSYATQHVFTYDKVYGAMASFPVFLLWLYITWLIVLLGAEISFADQHMKSYGKEKQVENVNFEFKEYLALHIMRYMGKRFHLGHAEVSVSQMSSDMNMPVRLVNEICYYLSEAHLVQEISPDEETYQVALPLERISVQKVLDALRKRGIRLEMESTQESKYLRSFLERLELATHKMTQNTTFLDIIKLSIRKKN